MWSSDDGCSKSLQHCRCTRTLSEMRIHTCTSTSIKTLMSNTNIGSMRSVSMGCSLILLVVCTSTKNGLSHTRRSRRRRKHCCMRSGPCWRMMDTEHRFPFLFSDLCYFCHHQKSTVLFLTLIRLKKWIYQTYPIAAAAASHHDSTFAAALAAARLSGVSNMGTVLQWEVLVHLLQAFRLDCKQAKERTGSCPALPLPQKSWSHPTFVSTSISIKGHTSYIRAWQLWNDHTPM